MAEKKKLLIILGAGSSVPSMPSVKQINALMESWSAEWVQEKALHNHYQVIRGAIEKYYASGSTGPVRTVNFETVLGEMIDLSHRMNPAPMGDPLCARPEMLVFNSETWFEGPNSFAATNELTDQRTSLLLRLAQHFRSLCRKAEISPHYKTLAGHLSTAFDVGVFNLNYDTLAELAWPEFFTGFNNQGDFVASELYTRIGWQFIYHLHGSVHHSLSRPNGTIVWESDLNSDKFNDGEPGLPQDGRSDGRPFPITTLVAGGFKLDQMLVEPFHSFQSALIRRAYEADAILVGGYGFGDEHVNRALRNRLEFKGMHHLIERPPVMVLEKTSDEARPTWLRNDSWSNGLNRALQTRLDTFEEPGGPHAYRLVPHDLVAKGSFEVSRDHKVALWHSGFGEAIARIDDIVLWLNGADDSVLIAPTA